MKNLLGFLIIPLLIFNLFAFSENTFASVKAKATINYTVTTQFNTNLDITLVNTSSSVSVVDYFTIFLPYQSISNVKATMPGKNISSTLFKQKDGTELTINLKSLVLQGREKKKFQISFDSLNPVHSNWGYAKIRAQIEGLDVSGVTLRYDPSRPEVAVVNGSNVTKNSNGNYIFSNITSPFISINFGLPVTFEYELNKTFLNESEQDYIQEVVLPVSDGTQTFVIERVSPEPSTRRVDSDGNAILGFDILQGKQTVVQINGYVVKSTQLNSEEYKDVDLETLGFWSISNQFEKQRLSNYLKENNLELNPANISKFVASRLELSKVESSKESTFENSLRLGPDTAIGRKDSAVAEDYVDLLIALLRENSIPARMIVGYFPESHQFMSTGGFHSWVEYYDLKNKVWKSIDPSTSDFFKSPKYDANNENTIKLLKRSTHYNLPKLPFLTSKDLKIVPTSKNITVDFKVDSTENEIINSGNISVVVLENDQTNLLLPKETYTVLNSQKIVVEGFDGQKKEFTFKLSEVLNNRNRPNFISEILLFLSFIILCVTFSYIYAKIKRGK